MLRSHRSPTWIALSVLALASIAPAALAQEDSRASAGVPDLTPAQWIEDLNVLATRLPEVHRNAFHTITREAFQSDVDELTRRIPELEDHEVVIELARIVASIGDGHTALRLADYERTGFRRYPIVLYDFTDGLRLVAAAPRHADAVGGRVVQVGNTDVAEVMRRVVPLVSQDNEMGVRRFAPLYLRIPEVLDALGLVEDMEHAVFTVEKDGREIVVDVEPVAADLLSDEDRFLATEPSALGTIDLVTMREPGAPVPLYLQHPDNPYWFQWLPESGTLYIQSNVISNDGEEPMAEVFARAFAAADSLPLERLVIDLRNNDGGNNSLNAPVFLGIIRRPEIDRADRLFVIIGRSTFSAASHLVTYLERFTHPTFVGEPTGGSPNHYGDARSIELPNSGLRARASTIYWQNSSPVPFEDRLWTAPGIAAELSSRDWARGVDPALDAILSYRPEEPLADRLIRAAGEGGPEAALAAFEAWMDDPAHAYADVESELNRTGYRLIDEERFPEAVAILYVNTRAYPGSINVWDSLGDAYVAAGRRREAIEAYEKAAVMDPNGSLGGSAARKAAELREES
ncbi:MAG TPA: hypothetical protein VFH69_10785 [Gemmatimonadota bacterium]|nr:hypothetical protein [Gemmatimonadota bacterium]